MSSLHSLTRFLFHLLLFSHDLLQCFHASVIILSFLSLHLPFSVSGLSVRQTEDICLYPLYPKDILFIPLSCLAVSLCLCQDLILSLPPPLILSCSPALCFYCLSHSWVSFSLSVLEMFFHSALRVSDHRHNSI